MFVSLRFLRFSLVVASRNIFIPSRFGMYCSF
jgi:hypothetical protein